MDIPAYQTVLPRLDSPGTRARAGGDHFNAGFCVGLVGGLEPAGALPMGVPYSGFHVRRARPPGIEGIPDFAEFLSKKSSGP